MKATVQWFNDSKGYGFIRTDDGRDVFAHYTAIETEGFKTLAEGQEVEFEMIEGPKGPQAAKIHKLCIRCSRTSKFPACECTDIDVMASQLASLRAVQS